MPRFLPLALLLAAPAGAASVVRAPAPAPLPPLAALAPALNAALAVPAALPALPSAAPALARPASLDTARAAVLVERARAMALPAVPAAKAEAARLPQVAPAKALEAVNAVLKDVSPERLAALPDSELHALGGLILDAATGAAPRADAAAVAVLARESAARVRSRLAPVERSLFKPGDDRHEEEIEVKGVPPGARWHVTDGSEVYRHYTTAEGVASITAGGGLWNGFVGYVQRSSGLWRKTFRDLNGLFLTKAGVPGDRVGVPAREYPHYVDVKLPAGLPVLELEEGSIFLVPLPARTRGWIADLYRRWAGGGKVEPHYEKTARDLDAEGGPGPDLSVPVTVVARGAAGR